MDLANAVRGVDERDWRTADPDEGPVRVAMVGVGWWTREQAMPAVAAGDYCETTVVVSGSPTKAAAVRDDSDAVDRALTYDEFVAGEATDAYDAAYVATPNAYHLQYVEAAAAHGKAVLCEKPLEASVDRAERLVAAADDAGIPLMVAYRMHTDPTVRRARELVASGLLGDPALVHGNMSERILDLLDVDPDADADDLPWRLNPDVVGPGTSVMDVGIYPLNTARFVLDADPVAVQGAMGSTTDAFAAVPDERAAFTVEYDGGVYAACTASQNAAIASHLRVIGTRGEVVVEPAFYPWQDRSLRVTRDGTTVDVDVSEVDQMTEEFDYFGDHLLSGTPFHADGPHGLYDVRTLVAVYEAADSGERVVV
jgi:xylose dehydrogenase (NAD/NADP)